MPTIIKLKEITSIVNEIDVITAMKEGFIQYSNGNSIVPPVGELLFDKPPGDVHIKYGYIKNQDFYVIKIASGFYENTNLGIPSGQGLMLLFKQQTGQLEAILLDEGYLTNIRTVAAAALAVKHFAPQQIKAVGIIGTGTIAKLQIQQLQQNKLCKSFYLWGRNAAKAQQLKSELGSDFDIHIAATCAEIAQNANVIITTTPSEIPLLQADDIKPGTLIVAVGSDTQHKQELASEILQKADLVIADSLPQSKSRGEVYQAVKVGAISEEKVVELGDALQDSNRQGTKAEQITVVDLTGVAVQDIMIASAVFSKKLFKFGF
jgi:ornithine cyclodeaminase